MAGISNSKARFAIVSGEEPPSKKEKALRA
jgi:hypothetical protein